jgi:hypothetical protein
MRLCRHAIVLNRAAFVVIIMSPPAKWGIACTSSASAGADHLVDKSVICAAILISAFCISALASGFLHVKWWLMNDAAKGKVWRMYGPFTGLMCIGSVFGCVAWSANMRFVAYYLPVMLANASSIDTASPSTISSSLVSALDAAPSALRWHAVFFITCVKPATPDPQFV